VEKLIKREKRKEKGEKIKKEKIKKEKIKKKNCIYFFIKKLKIYI
jgi:hypothetical protein